MVRCRGAEDGCEWYVKATKVRNSEMFSIRRYSKIHACSRENSALEKKRTKGNPQMVAAVIKNNFPGHMETPDPTTLMTLVKRKSGVEVSYSTALRGQHKAVHDRRGTLEEGYKNVFSYLYILEQKKKVYVGAEPRFKSEYAIGWRKKRFKYLFFSFVACIEGFGYMRKVITVDATFLKVVEGGVLIIATVQDPDHHNYPLAIVVADGEKKECWNSVFTKLKTVIADSSELVFVRDINGSLIKAIAKLF